VSDTSIPQKCCSKCGKLFPATIEFFYRNTKTQLRPEYKTCLLNYQRARRKENPERDRAYSKMYAAKYPEKTKERQRRHRKKRPDLFAARQKRCNAKYPEKAKIRTLLRNAKKKSLPAEFNERDWQRCLDFFYHTCAYCGAQRDFWYALEMDHYIPITSHYCPGTVRSNIVPACKSCNASKNNKDALEWLISRFGKRKAKAILARILNYFSSL